ncbi:MAG: hypothetical protein PVH64_11120 [Bacillota bacterium]|jgi:hypothetical protein
MTTHLKKTWLLLAVAFGIALVYRWCGSRPDRAPEQARPTIGLKEARRLLRIAPRIMANEQAGAARLLRLKQRFLKPERPRKMRLQLLKLVEDLADQSGLSVQIKNTVAYSQTELGVSLEGTASFKRIVRFLQQLTAAPRELQVKRVQLHSVPEQRVLDYQITICTLVVE